MQPSVAYFMLGVEPGCGESAARAAYRVRALEKHPDKGGTDEDFQSLQQARDVVCACETNPPDAGVENNLHDAAMNMFSMGMDRFVSAMRRELFAKTSGDVYVAYEASLAQAYRGEVVETPLFFEDKTVVLRIDTRERGKTLFAQQGKMMPGGRRGDITVEVSLAPMRPFRVSGQHGLHTTVFVNLHLYLVGGPVRLQMPDESFLTVDVPSAISRSSQNRVVFAGKGLPNSSGGRGSLFLELSLDIDADSAMYSDARFCEQLKTYFPSNNMSE
jgi:DnaJ-class molecular chaperone